MAHKEYKVKPGDCISSIAYAHGLFPETIWNDPKNSGLKGKRESPNILLPGDVVQVREKEEKEEDCASEQKHRFRRKGVPETLKLVVKVDGKPVADEPYVLTVDGQNYSGTTDGEGRIDQVIPPDAQTADLTVGEGSGARTHKLKLGNVDPVSETSGVKARLRNLGYYRGPLDETTDENTTEAIKAFQQDAGLDPSGEVDQKTRDALVKEHGS